MRHTCNWVCCFAATVLFLAPWARAQDVGAPPSPADTMAAYRAVDGWVRQWRIGKVETFKPGEPQVPACIAASVTLRLAGETIARGVEVASNDQARQSIIADATRAALAEAEPKLGVPRDALYEATLRDVAKRITISIQLAGDPIPISPKDAAEAMAMVNPGVEGVGARLGDRLAVNFPERMLTTQTEPGPALGTLVGKLAGDATLAVEPLSKLAKDHSAVFYRFRVSHLAQPRVEDSPVFLHRCGKHVPSAAMDEAELHRWADSLAASLLARRSESKALVAATLDPLAAATEPLASPFVQLSVMEALDHYAARKPEQERDTYRKIVRNMMRELIIDVDAKDRLMQDPAAASLAWERHQENWLTDDQPGGGDESFTEWCWAAVRDSFDVSKGFKSTVPLAGRGAVCQALAFGSFSDVKEDNVSLARAAIQRSYADAGPGGMPSMMPWLGWADVVVSGVEYSRTRTPEQRAAAGPRRYFEGPLASAVALREMRAQLWKHQLRSEELPPDQQDLAGGILFTTTNQTMPTWQSARPLAFIATMLGDPRLTEDKEVPEELSRLLLSLRFLRQLTAGQAECFMYKNPDRAKGGVRSSLWDQRMPPEATAMTLLTVCETLRSLDEIRKRQDAKAHTK